MLSSGTVWRAQHAHRMGGDESLRLGRGYVGRSTVHFVVQRAIGSPVHIYLKEGNV